jgi:hypothetical protein
MAAPVGMGVDIRKKLWGDVRQDKLFHARQRLSPPVLVETEGIRARDWMS